MKRIGLVIASSAALITAYPSHAQTKLLDVRAAPLSEALLDLARQSGIELVFDRALTQSRRSGRVRGQLSPEAALQRLLLDSGLSARQSAPGLFVVEPSSATLAREDVVVPEILVIGRRNQNADIRRLETGIQPYRVATGSEVIAADRDNLDQYFRSRVPSSTTAVPPSLETNGETISKIDLRGAGADETLILIDGRRMPRIPVPPIPVTTIGFRQPDLNALPLYAVERVEVLTGTSSGLHGFGALGGVVNAVVAGDRRGAELHASAGMSTRGDAFRSAWEGGFSLAPGHGQTTIRVYAGHTREEPLRHSDRDYRARDLALTRRNLPQAAYSVTSGRSVVYEDFFLEPLQLKPQFGGGILPGSMTFVTVGRPLTNDTTTSALKANVGQQADTPTIGALESWIGSAATTEAFLASIKRQFNNGVEAYADAVLLRNRGRYQGADSSQFTYLSPEDEQNPFNSDVIAYFPIEGASADRRVTVRTERFTTGVIAPLHNGWRANAEFGFGMGGYRYAEEAVDAYDWLGLVSPFPNLLGDWSAFQAAIKPYLDTSVTELSVENRYRNLSLRLAGPLFQTRAGPATLTLLAERRTEGVPSYFERTVFAGQERISPIAPHRSATVSLYGELSAPLLDADARFIPLRALEVQLAVRKDEETHRFARAPRDPESERIRAVFAATAYTLGAKVAPARWLTLRTSYASGASPPPLTALIERTSTFLQAIDPKRGGELYRLRGDAVVYMNGGSPDLGVVKATTFALGALATPFGPGGPRFTVDYSRIRKRDDVYLPTSDEILKGEDAWPDRVARAPLTEMDRARGYSGGLITLVDARALNASRLKLDTLDVRLDWRRPLAGGAIRAYGDASWYIQRVLATPFTTTMDVVEYIREPLRWQGNVGLEWSRGPVSVAANLQHFDSYRINQSRAVTPLNAIWESAQGGRVGAQTFVDLHGAWRLRPRSGAIQDATIRLGVVNLFDRSPARESAASVPAAESLGYSRFGDPRGRRIVFTLSGSF